MGVMDEPAGQGLNGVSGEGAKRVGASSDGSLEPLSRGLRLSADVACLALLLYSWLAGREQLAPLVTLWLASNLAIPWPRIRERLRQRSMATVVILLLGLGVMAATIWSGLPGGEPRGGLYHFRNVFQGAMFALAGFANLVALRAYPDRQTTPKMPTSFETAPPGNLSSNGRRMDDRSCPNHSVILLEAALRRVSVSREPPMGAKRL